MFPTWLKNFQNFEFFLEHLSAKKLSKLSKLFERVPVYPPTRTHARTRSKPSKLLVLLERTPEYRDGSAVCPSPPPPLGRTKIEEKKKKFEKKKKIEVFKISKFITCRQYYKNSIFFEMQKSWEAKHKKTKFSKFRSFSKFFKVPPRAGGRSCRSRSKPTSNIVWMKEILSSLFDKPWKCSIFI